MAVTGWLAAAGLGCSAELPRSLGSIDTSREAEPRGYAAAKGLGETSEWEVIRAASEPAWVGDADWSPDAPPADSEEEPRASSDRPDAERTTAGSPDEALVVVDRRHGLPPDYVPGDLAHLQPLGIPTLRGERMKLRDEAAEAAAGMLEDARSAGFELLVCSAYRSHGAQVVSYGRLTAIHGENAKAFSAPPGHSEHQLGTVIDVSNARVGYRLNQRFGETGASEWLRNNAADYGFVLSYPRGAEEYTGYEWEPWHYRYIGRENARDYRQGDYASPQQFFLKEGVVPDE